jgi:hypothetical protein
LCIDREDTFGYKVIGMTDNGNIKFFKANGDNAFDSKYDLVEAGEPKEGEWCLFTDSTFYGAVLLPYLNTTTTGRFHAIGTTSSFDNCAKFTGELPEHLKDV